jgi:hypothetical protein
LKTGPNSLNSGRMETESASPAHSSGPGSQSFRPFSK